MEKSRVRYIWEQCQMARYLHDLGMINLYIFFTCNHPRHFRCTVNCFYGHSLCFKGNDFDHFCFKRKQWAIPVYSYRQSMLSCHFLAELHLVLVPGEGEMPESHWLLLWALDSWWNSDEASCRGQSEICKWQRGCRDVDFVFPPGLMPCKTTYHSTVLCSNKSLAPIHSSPLLLLLLQWYLRTWIISQGLTVVITVQT